MKKLICTAIILFICSSSFSQSKNIKITGKIVALADSIPLESATVYLERIKDSSVINYTISDKKGLFTLEDKIYDSEINLFVTYVGYQTYSKKINLNTSEINLQTIFLKDDENLLGEILIKSRAPITIKKDTLEFNVKSFDTKADANIEDLLKKLPGVEVDENGKIKVNGKEVNKILVNGKPFFKDDPLIATRNLTKEMIEKIQVTDTKSKAEAFLGEEGEQLNKTINLVIKEENNKGAFGSINVGAGSNDRYEASGMLNLFNNDRRLSIVAGGNNANSSRFSLGGISSMMGGLSPMVVSERSVIVNGSPYFGSGGSGITTSRNGGVNYADKFGEKVDFTTDYFYSTSSSENENKVKRENILPDSRYFSNSESKSNNENENHRINFDTEIEIDSTLMISFSPSISYSKSTAESTSDEETLNENQELTNKSNAANFSESTNKSFNNGLSISKKLNNKGGHLRLYLSNSNRNQDSKSYLDSSTEIFGNTPSITNRDQQITSKNKSNNTSVNFTYRLPIIAKELFAEFKYSFDNQKQENSKYAYEFDENTSDFTQYEEDQSSDFTYSTIKNSTGFNFNLRKEKISASLGSNIVFRTLENSDYLRPELDLKRKFTSLALNSNIRFRPNKSSSFSFGYNLRNSPPSISKLQPFKNISNPLNTIIGNPNLEPSDSHRFNLNYYNSNVQKKSGYSAYAGITIRNNTIVSKSTIDENFVRVTTYANVDGNRSMYGNASYYKTIKLDSVKSVRFNIGMGMNTSKSVNFSNGEKYNSNNNSLSPSLSITFNWQDVLEISPRYSLSFSKNKYDIALFKDRNYSRHSFSVNTRTSVPKNLEWRNNVNYSYNPNITNGFKKSSWNWNTTFSYKFAKEKFTASLKIYDLLNQRTNASRIATENYIQDSESSILKRYFMFSLKWKFNTTGSHQSTRSRSFMLF